MSDPGYQPRHYSPASIIGASAQSRAVALPSAPPFASRKPVTLTDADKAAIADALANGGQGLCIACGAIHVKPSTPACPRLATWELNGDGTLKAGSNWPDGFWDSSRVLYPEDAAESLAPEAAQ